MDAAPDALVDRFAARHYGLIPREEARNFGLTPRQIEHRLAAGRWKVVCRGLYRAAAAANTWQQRALAACLAGPPQTSSHLTAAAVHGLGDPPTEPHVTMPTGTSGRRVPGRVHHSALTPMDRLVAAGIPVTSPSRTLVDCAGVVGYHRLCDMVDTAFCAGPSHPFTIPAVIERAMTGHGRKGVASLRAAIKAWSEGIAPGSPAEMRLLCVVCATRPAASPARPSATDGRLLRCYAWRLRSVLGLSATHRPDEKRQLLYASVGWLVRRVGKHDLLPSVTWLDEHLGRVGRLAAA